jgi:hypothetical protein
MPLAEVSVDGGSTWRQVPLAAPGTDVAITALTAASGGFTASVQVGEQATIWTSADGTRWAQADVSSLAGGGTHQLSALAPVGGSVTGIGLTATAQRQQPFVLTLAGSS